MLKQKNLENYQFEQELMTDKELENFYKVNPNFRNCPNIYFDTPENWCDFTEDIKILMESSS